jgi:prophage regulatory protein
MAEGPKRLIPKKTVLERIPLSNSSLWRKINAGTFPRPVHVSTRRSMWLEDEIDAFVAARIAERDQAAAERPA